MIMNKKNYIIPIIEIEEMELSPLMEASITEITGADLPLGEGDIPGTADSRFFDDIDF